MNIFTFNRSRFRMRVRRTPLEINNLPPDYSGGSEATNITSNIQGKNIRKLIT
jgi:hypothetical protein